MIFYNLNEQDYPSLVASIIILVFMASRVISSGMPPAKMLKYFAIWGFIGLLIILLYSYRFEFNNLKQRIIGELNPSSPMVDSNNRIIINISQDQHFYLKAKINDQEILFLVDTGASNITLSKDDAKKVGIDLKKLNFNRPYQTANGKSWGANITVKNFTIANFKLKELDISVNQSPMGVSLFGMSGLRKFKKYEFYNDKLILEPFSQ